MTEPVAAPKKIRALRSFTADDRQVAVGEEIELAWAKAAYWIEKGCAEPVFDLAPFRPSLPPEGCSLLEAFRLHVEGEPNVVALSAAVDLSWWRHRLYPRKYRDPPTWQTAWRGVNRRSRPRRIYSSFVWGLNADGRESRRPPPTPFVERYDRACLVYFVDLAIHNFLDRLARGELVAKGMWHGAAAPHYTKVEPWWLIENLVFDFRERWLCELVPDGPKYGEGRFVDVRVYHPQGRQYSSARAEAECKEWMCELAKTGAPEKTREELWREASGKFGSHFSRRAYERCRAAARQINPDWGRSGRKRKRIDH